jgi:hypothetical protein
MRDLVGELRTRISEYEAHNAAANREFEEILALARQVHAGCQKTEPLLLSAAEAAGVGEQARHGQLIQALAQVDRIKPSPNRGGLVPWIVTHLDVTRGRARSIALAARQIGAVPELAALLSTGRIGTETVRVLTRAACAVKDTSRDEIEIVTATHELARREGIAAANRYVRSLEEIADPRLTARLLAKQCQRSFTRFIAIEDGMCRIEALLDAERATTVRAAFDLCISADLQARRDERTEPASGDGAQGIELLQAQALTRLAETYLKANSPRRETAALALQQTLSRPNAATDANSAAQPSIPAQRTPLSDENRQRTEVGTDGTAT